MEIIRIPRIMTETSKGFILRGRTIGFVPTMGALHDGHISLIRRAKSENEIVVVSIFVNPAQFGPKEDFDKYPRNIEGDMEKLEREGVHILFLPEVSAIYPEGFSSYITVRDLSDKLCGAFRTGHFTGVATVVCKLFNIVKPASAYFGQKDFQQAVIIRRMIEDLNMDVDLIICPTFRESDGLAMSSRNAYLSREERKAASVIYKALISGSQLIKSGTSNPVSVSKQIHDLLKSEPLVSEIQYAGVYDIDTLDELVQFKKQNLLALAVKIGNTRLIDNMIVEF